MNQTLIIVAAENRVSANADIRATGMMEDGLDPVSIPLYPAGLTVQPAATHFWCSWGLDDADLAEMQTVPNLMLFVYNLLSDPGFPSRKLVELGLETKRMYLP